MVHAETFETVYILLKLCRDKMPAALSQGGPRDAAVHCDTYRIFQRLHAVTLPQHAFLVGLSDKVKK